MLLDLITPLFNVISVDENNSYGFPRYEVIERLEKHKRIDDYLIMTSSCGNVSFGKSDGKLVYCLEKDIREEELMISWFILGSIIFIFVSYAVISVKVKKIEIK